MGYELPEKLKTIQPYAPVSGEFHVHLDANESFLNLPSEILEEICEAVKDLDFRRYPDPESRKVCEKYGAFLGIDPKLITAGNGSDELISIIMSSFGEAGDRVLVASPDFSMYEFYAKSYGLVPEFLEKEEGSLTLDKEAFVRKAKETGCRIAIFSNPCNPSSVGILAEEVLEIAEALNCLVVADEAYMDFTEGSVVKEAERLDNLVVLKTCSKAFGLAAIRLGFAIANPRLTGILKAVKSPYNVSALTQKAGEIVLSHKEYLQECIEKIRRERDFLYEEMKRLEEEFPYAFTLYPTKTNFVYLRLERAKELFLAMKEEKIAVRLMKDCVRISAGSRQENRKLLGVFQEFLKAGKEAGA